MITANKRLGQHFLKNESILDKIVDLLDPNLKVVEVGAGSGYLTQILAQKFKKIIAIEKDERFKVDLDKIKNTQSIIGDITELDLDKITSDAYQAVGNLPYYLEKKIIHLFFKLRHSPQKMVFLIQREVAEELCQADFTLFSVSVKFYCKPKCGFIIKKGSFSPMPKVDGRMVILENINYPLPFGLQRKKIEKDFFRLLHFGFSSPRKKLFNNLVNGLKIEKQTLQKILIRAKIESGIRAQNMDLEKWLKLYKNLPH